MRRIALLCALLALPATSVRGAEDNWPQFRGSHAGVARGKHLPDSWSTTKNVAWKQDIPGKGWSSPVVWGDKVFLTTVVTEGKPKLPMKGLYIKDVIGKVPDQVQRRMVFCLDWKTGKVQWKRTAHQGKPTAAIHVKNTYASETPVTDGKRVYAYFGNLGLFCYDLKGKKLWERKWPSHKTRFGWGTAASPVLYKDRVYIVNDNEEKSFLVALDAKTGDEVWRVPRKEKSNWATPFIWENGKRTEIVTPGSGKVRSYGLDGKLLWEFGGMSSIAIPTPSARHGLLYVSSGYVLDFRRPVFAIRPGASGDITLKDGKTRNDFIAWCQKLAGPYHPSPLVYNGYLYVLYDRGFLACYDARTGKEVYKKQRLHPRSTAFTASPWAADGKVFCLSEDGDTYVIRAGPKFKVVGKNSLDEMTLATPAVVRDSVLVRTATRLYRIRQGKAVRGK
jgi:outer membrane protein assembly factor BamB